MNNNPPLKVDKSTSYGYIQTLQDRAAKREKARAPVLPQFTATSFVGLAILCAGTVMYWPLPVIGHLIEHVDELDRRSLRFLKPEGVSWAIRSAPLGSVLMTPFVYLLCTRVGPRACILSLAAAPLFLGWVLIGASFLQDEPFSYLAGSLLFSGRFLCGAGSMAALVGGCVYIAEIPVASMKIVFYCAIRIFLVIGGLLSCLSAKLGAQWQACLCAIPVTMFCVLITWLPEGPTALLIRKKYTDARLAMCRLRGVKSRSDDYLKKILDRLKSPEYEPWKHLKEDLKVRNDFIRAIALLAFVGCSGANYVETISHKIFEKRNGEDISPGDGRLISGVIQIISTAIYVTAIKKNAHRRFMMITSSVIMGVCLLMLAGYFCMINYGITNDTSFRYISTLITIVYCTAYGGGAGTGAWVCACELLNVRVRILGFCIGCPIFYICRYIVYESLISYFPQNENMYHIRLWIYAALNFLHVLFLHFSMKEINRTFQAREI